VSIVSGGEAVWTDKFGLVEKVAIVTGASRGIGERTAMLLAEAGAKVVLAARKPAPLEEVAHRIYRAGGDATPISADVSRVTDCEDLVRRSRDRYGGIDVLVNNAGVNTHSGPSLNCSEGDWDTMFRVNLYGPFHLSGLCVPYMEERGKGSIVNIASQRGIRPSVRSGAYGVTKAALIMLTKVLALELADRNIRVNAVAPGITRTKFTEGVWKDEFRAAEVKRNVPLGRMAEPEEIAPAVLYLAGDASGFVTGTVLSVDGGTII